MHSTRIAYHNGQAVDVNSFLWGASLVLAGSPSEVAALTRRFLPQPEANREVLSLADSWIESEMEKRVPFETRNHWSKKKRNDFYRQLVIEALETWGLSALATIVRTQPGALKELGLNVSWEGMGELL